jgi:hypothetical protein
VSRHFFFCFFDVPVSLQCSRLDAMCSDNASKIIHAFLHPPMKDFPLNQCRHSADAGPLSISQFDRTELPLIANSPAPNCESLLKSTPKPLSDPAGPVHPYSSKTAASPSTTIATGNLGLIRELGASLGSPICSVWRKCRSLWFLRDDLCTNHA